jgi:hypothetical protein
MTREKRIAIGEATYELTPWRFEDASLWAFRFLRWVGMVGGLVGNAKSDLEALMAVIAVLKESDFIALRDQVVKQTRLVTPENPNETIPLDAQVHLSGRLLVLVALIRAHLEGEFAPFFDGLGSVLGKLDQPQGS